MAIIINKGICNAKLQGPASSPSLKKTLIQAPAKTYRNVQGYERHNFNLFQTYFKPISNLFQTYSQEMRMILLTMFLLIHSDN